MMWSEEAANVDQMIRSFTVNGAKADVLERTTSSIEVGKSADLIFLDQNLFETSPDGIFNASVPLTMFQGRPLFDAGALCALPAESSVPSGAAGAGSPAAPDPSCRPRVIHALRTPVGCLRVSRRSLAASRAPATTRPRRRVWLAPLRAVRRSSRQTCRGDSLPTGLHAGGMGR